MYLYAKTSSICKLLCIISDRVPNFSFDTTKNSCMQPNLDHTWGPWSLWTLEVVTTMKRWILSLWLHPLSQLGATNWTMFLATVMFANELPRFKAPALMNFLTKECVLSATRALLILVVFFGTLLPYLSLTCIIFFLTNMCWGWQCLGSTLSFSYFPIYLPTYLHACCTYTSALSFCYNIFCDQIFSRKNFVFFTPLTRNCRLLHVLQPMFGHFKIAMKITSIGKEKKCFQDPQLWDICNIPA